LNARQPPRVAVIGPSQATAEQSALAEQVGAEIARRGAVLVCGGLGGVMEAAARGAKQAGGLTIGILPGDNPGDANPFITIPIATGMGEARNVILVRTAGAFIAVGGAFGTLSEIALALRAGKPVIGLGTWQLRAPDGTTPAIQSAASPAEAVDKALRR
jgi:uncharacterized protein (TIGR00725 family)